MVLEDPALRSILRRCPSSYSTCRTSGQIIASVCFTRISRPYRQGIQSLVGPGITGFGRHQHRKSTCCGLRMSCRLLTTSPFSHITKKAPTECHDTELQQLSFRKSRAPILAWSFSLQQTNKPINRIIYFIPCQKPK